MTVALVRPISATAMVTMSAHGHPPRDRPPRQRWWPEPRLRPAPVPTLRARTNAEPARKPNRPGMTVAPSTESMQSRGEPVRLGIGFGIARPSSEGSAFPMPHPCLTGSPRVCMLSLDGETVPSVELWRADGSMSVAAPAALGLRLADAQAILARLQTELVASQVGQLSQRNAACRRCGTRLRIKDYRARRLDTLFGRVTLRLPRRGCPSCRTTPAIDAVFASRATPELVLTQAKLAAHLPYCVAGRLLGDFLPLDAGISHTAIRSRAMIVGQRLGRRPTDPPSTSDPSPMIVTLDGAFIRAVPAAGVRHMQESMQSRGEPVRHG